MANDRDAFQWIYIYNYIYILTIYLSVREVRMGLQVGFDVVYQDARIGWEVEPKKGPSKHLYVVCMYNMDI